MEVTGKVVRVFDVQEISDKFKKQEIVIEVQDGKYPQSICVQFTNDKIALLAAIYIDDEVTISCNLRGRIVEMKDGSERCFNSIEGWKITDN